MAGLSPFQPCCPCQPPIDCCHCTDSPRQLTVDLGAGGWTNKRCNNCAAVNGVFTLDYNATMSTALALCVWDYFDDDFCDDSDAACTDPWRLWIYVFIDDVGGGDCTVELQINVQCFGSLLPSECYGGGASPPGCSQVDSIEWFSPAVDNVIAATDMECDTADWPLSLAVRTPRDDCERNVHVTCSCWDELPTPLSVAEV